MKYNYNEIDDFITNTDFGRSIPYKKMTEHFGVCRQTASKWYRKYRKEQESHNTEASLIRLEHLEDAIEVILNNDADTILSQYYEKYPNGRSFLEKMESEYVANMLTI